MMRERDRRRFLRFPLVLHHSELFLHQFCDAHSCSGKHKPFSRRGKGQGSFFRLAAGALILVLLPVFYLFLYLIQSDMKGRTQELRRISKAGWKAKPS